MKRLVAIALCLLACAAVAAPAAAGELAGVKLPDTAKVGDHNLVLNGMALRSKAVFKVYVGGLYLPMKQGDWKQVLAADTPRHMVMHWVRTVDKKSICEAWTECLEANSPDASADVEKNFRQLCTWMQEARAGDQFTFSYLPGTGTQVTVAGANKGTLGGKPFADALFACWIGEHPGPGEAFRDDLMGQ
jgi:hypothetical protein